MLSDSGRKPETQERTHKGLSTRPPCKPHRKAPGRDRIHDLLALRRPLHHLVAPGTSCRVIVYKWVAFHTSNLHSWSTGFLGSRTVLADRPRNQLASPPLMGFPPRKHKSHTYWWTVKEMVPSVSYWSGNADVQSCWLHLGICCYFGDCYVSSRSHLLSRIVTCILDRERAPHTLSPGSALPDSLGLHWLVAGWSHVSCTASSWCSHLGKYTVEGLLCAVATWPLGFPTFEYEWKC